MRSKKIEHTAKKNENKKVNGNDNNYDMSGSS